MTVLATGQFTDASRWARGDGLQIVMVVLGIILLSRAVGTIGRIVTNRIDLGADQAAASTVDRSEQLRHRHSVAQVLVWLANVLLISIGAVRVINLLGFSITGLVAPAAVLGVALGFGAQRIVQDLLAGFFIITERQYGFGDVIRISSLGDTKGVEGTVEEISLRITRMRSVDGEVIIVPNGQIQQVTNLSRDWARAVVDIPLLPSTDIAEANRILQEVMAAAWEDERLQSLMFDKPTVIGVERIDVRQVTVRIVARTVPDKHFEVQRALRARVIAAFRKNGITLPSEAAMLPSPMAAP
ncbi:MAG TPA: mechanosensitive ion channel family protein [Sporichthyaceae bacterium]|jgi:small conductance mechanosensitive channel